MAHYVIDRVVSKSADGWRAQVIVNGATKHLWRNSSGEWSDAPNRQGVFNTYSGI